MKIALDLRMLIEPPDGISRYALELLRGLPKELPFAEVLAVGDRDRIARQLGAQQRVLAARTSSISLAEQLELPALLYREAVDVFHATLFVAPALYHRPCVLTLHDVNYMVLPQLYGQHRKLYFQTAVRLFAKQAKAIVTVSDFSRREIEQHLKIPAERVEVIGNGVDPRFRPASREALQQFREEKGLPAEYLLYVGSYAPHKNVPTLLRAYARLEDAPPLVLCGRNPETIRAEVEALGLGSRVVLFPASNDEELPLLYSGATLFVFPSRYEGFGLPPLEAMACGTPVIAANAGSLPEVTDGAAVLFMPDDDVALANRIGELLGSSDKRAELAMRGRVRAAQFTWESSVQRHAAIYRRVA